MAQGIRAACTAKFQAVRRDRRRLRHVAGARQGDRATRGERAIQRNVATRDERQRIAHHQTGSINREVTALGQRQVREPGAQKIRRSAEIGRDRKRAAASEDSSARQRERADVQRAIDGRRPAARKWHVDRRRRSTRDNERVEAQVGERSGAADDRAIGQSRRAGILIFEIQAERVAERRSAVPGKEEGACATVSPGCADRATAPGERAGRPAHG